MYHTRLKIAIILDGIFAPFSQIRRCNMPINKVTDSSGKAVKKDGKQKYSVKINYVDSNGDYKQVKRIAYGLDEAKLMEQQLSQSVKEQALSSRITVRHLYDEYIAAKKYEVRETSLKKTEQVLTLHVLPEFENTRIDKLNTQNLQKWKQTINDGDYQIRTKQNFYKEFRAFLNYAVKMEYLPKNPLLKVGNFKAPMELKKEMDFYTPEEFQLFIKSAKDFAEENNDIVSWSYHTFFCIAYYTGMRKGEIYALTWNDITDSEIHITKSLTQKLEGGDRITPPKNQSSVRVIQIPKPLLSVLNEHKERCKAIDGFSENCYICGGIRPVRDTSVENANKKFAEAAGVKKIRIHDFRHSHASLLANEGINIQEIARRLGHSDVSITLKVYSHLYPTETERALTVLDKVKME